MQKMPHQCPDTSAMRHLDLRQIEVFYYVARLGSFSKAAEALLLTQPTISGHIKALEDNISLVLFDRLGRGISLTRAGEVLYGYAKRLLATKTAALQALQELQGGVQGELVVGGSSIPGQYILPIVLGDFKRHYPGIIVLLRITDTMETLERIIHGDLELGLVGAHVPHPQVAYQPFVHDELVVAVPPGHPWAVQQQVALMALPTEPFIQRERGSGSRLVIERTLQQHGLEPTCLRVTAEMGSTEAIKQGIKAGVGISIISRLALADELRARTLCAITVEEVAFRRSFYIIHHKVRAMAPLAQTFARFLGAINPEALFAPESARAALS
jgi:DNA-binding transcriptional LysR family regulator